MNEKCIIIFLFIVLWTSCDNDLDLLYEQPPFPVVYCLFNPADSNYYVALTKSVSADRNAFELVRDPNNVFFDSADIRLTGWDYDSALWSTGFVLTDIEKTEGLFPQTSGYLYQSQRSVAQEPELINYQVVNPIKSYKLEVFIPELNYSLTSTIKTIRRLSFRKPVESISKISFTPEPLDIVLFARDENAYYKELWMRFRYKDVTNDQEIQREARVVMNRYLHADANGLIELKIDITRLLNKLRTFIPPKPDSVNFRRVVDFDLSVVSADENYRTYTETYDNLYEGSGFIWSNFDGDGVGLFSHYISVDRNNLLFAQQTIDSIALSPIAETLGFVKWQ